MNWKLKDILMVGITGVLFSFVFLAADYLGTAITALFTPIGLGAAGYEPFYGLWFMAGTFAVYVTRKKGACLVAEMIASVIEVILGGMFGPMVFVTGFVQGFGAELAFILTGYKKYNMATMCLSACICSACCFVWTYFMYGFSALSIGMLAFMFVVRMISAVVFAGIGCKLLADGLAKAGVLRGYALGMAQAEELE